LGFILLLRSDPTFGRLVNMDIQYFGHSAFKIKATTGTVVTDPYDAYVGFSMSGVSADVVTVSHQHQDHNSVNQVKGTARRNKPFIVDKPGEYEVGGISVFGVPTFHDDDQGTQRGANIIFTTVMEGVKVCHLGDLGHEPTQDQIAEIGSIDVLMVPVGGVFTLDPIRAVKVTHMFEPAYVIPMHYKTPDHNQDVFSQLATLDEFLKAYGSESKPTAKLTVESSRLPEETELVVLVQT
jgi:L-ascorbate metabolism protein UlaG (beta-lactamase superfamily)